MKKILVILTFLSSLTFAQRSATQQVNYLVSYSQEDQRFTAWVVPNYSTPNHFNPNSEEKGATAQFSLKVPRGVDIHSIRDIRGNWEKNPTKLENNDYFKQVGINTNFDYYIIGKAPTETNYGVFQADEPVALFSFGVVGEKEKISEVKLLENDDEFVRIAYDKLALNVASSFYSRSGQAAKMEAQPLEQFAKRTTLQAMMQRLSEKFKDTEVLLMGEGDDVTNRLLAYPNPMDTSVTLKFFAHLDGQKGSLNFMDAAGKVLQTKELTTKLGMNTITLDVDNYSSGNYLVAIVLPSQKLIKKLNRK